MRKRISVAAALLAISAMLFSAGTTLAFIAISSNPVINTFTIGNIQLSLRETTGEAYQMIPGTEMTKDPRLTVKAGSDACWLFFRMESTGGLENYMTYAPAEGWTQLPGYPGVYYRQVGAAVADVTYPLLLNDSLLVRDTLTEEELAAVQVSPTLAFTGYAIQQIGMATAQDAWQELINEGVTG